MQEIRINPFERFNSDWALVTAGTPEHYNSMTISWGSMGTIWNKPVVSVYVRPDRYTWRFLKENDTFTVSGMLFQDAWNLDLDRLRRCYICEMDSRRGMVPFCAYNLTDTEGRSLYRT